MKKILITGTAGFIGSHLAISLLENGYEVVGLDNINDYYENSLKFGRLKLAGIPVEKIVENELIQSIEHKNYKFIKMDLRDKAGLKKLCAQENFTDVCNLAAQAGVRHSLKNPDAYIDSNIAGFLNVLECCRMFKICNLSYASSSSVYGLNKQQPFKTTDKTDSPASLYAATKKSNELMAHAYSHLFGINTVGLRFFTVYGPWGRPDMAPMLFTKAIMEGTPIKVFNYGDMNRDFTYIDDIIGGLKKVIESPSEKALFKIYNIGSSKPVQLMDFISILEEELGVNAIKQMLPMQDGDVESTYADVTDLADDYSYRPSTSLQSGIRHFVKWYKEFYK